MNLLTQKFTSLKNKPALIPFITCGDPDINTTEQLIFTLYNAGGDIIELGIPFSDPIADGPIIQASTYRALKNNITIVDTLDLVKKIKQKIEIPIVLMSYFNPIYKYGVDKFVKLSKLSALDGIIISDLPLEEAKPIKKMFNKVDIDLILLVAPTTEEKRIKTICQVSSGFIYCISRLGTTGIRDDIAKELNQFIKTVKKYAICPVAVGFGISNPYQAKIVSQFADGIIIGSAIVKIIEENINNNKNLIRKVNKFISEIKKVIV